MSAHREGIGERALRLARRHRLALSLIVVYLLVRAVILAVSGR